MKLLSLALAVLASVASGRAAALNPQETLQLIRTVDERESSSGDWAMHALMETKEKDKTDVVYELTVFRRSADQKFIVLFLAPKSEAGKGYLRIDRNLWYYDPGTGRWDRRTERERIGGGDSRRGDLDESRLSEEYDCAWEAGEKLGKFDVHRVRLQVKPGLDVAFPVVRLWIDVATGNVLKRQDLALSGRIMRTSYFPRWRKVYSESKKGDVWFPEEMRFYDELDKANQTVLYVKEVDPRPLPTNMFTKAWLESKSR